MRTRFPLFWNWVQFISFRSAIHLVDLTTVFQNTHDVIRDRVGYFCASKHCFYQIENIAFVISVNRHRQPKQRSEKYRKKTEKISKGNRNTHHEHRQGILDTNTKCFVDFPDGAGTILIWSVGNNTINKNKKERKKETKPNQQLSPSQRHCSYLKRNFTPKHPHKEHIKWWRCLQKIDGIVTFTHTKKGGGGAGADSLNE